MLRIGEIHTRSAAWMIAYTPRRRANTAGLPLRARESRSIDPSSRREREAPEHAPGIGRERARRSLVEPLRDRGGLSSVAWLERQAGAPRCFEPIDSAGGRMPESGEARV